MPDGLNNSPAFNKCTFVIRDQPSPFASSAGPLKISRSADSNEDEYKWDRRKPPEGQQRKKAHLDDYCDVPEDDYKVPKLDLPARVPRGAAGRPLPKFSYGEVNPGSITTCAPKMSTSNENEDMDYVNSSTLKIQMPKNNHKPLPSLPQEQPAGAASGVGYSRATTSNEPLCARAGTSQTPSQFGRKDSEEAQESAAALPQVPPKPARTNKELESDYENSLGSSGKKKPAGERKNQKS